MPSEAPLAPISESGRVPSLDVLRGVAVLGILAMNIMAFSMPAATYFDPTAHGDLTGLNRWVWLVTHTFADLKFMAIFSMLFGADVALMADRIEARDAPARGLHLRRMAWLTLFGLMHAHLLWYDDVLFWYGLCGMIVYRFRKKSPRTLFTLGIAAIAIPSLMLLAGGLTMHFWPAPMMASIVEDLKPSLDAVAKEISAYQGGWLSQMRYRVAQALEMETSIFLSWALWRVSGLMLLGIGLYRSGVLHAARSPRFYGTMIGAAVLVGIPLTAYGIHWNFSIDWKAPEFFFFGAQFNYWASIPMSLGWIGLVMLACQRPDFARILRPFAAVGRMAFTNYILQTVVCTTIFYGHGLGLFGRVERMGQALIVLGVWAFQLALSPVWLRRFQFGPLEWLWRSLVYQRRQPFRRPRLGMSTVGRG